MKDLNNQKGLNSIWTDNLARNQRPDSNALVHHLRTVHQENTGFTELCASSCRDESGRNSYEWLAEIVPDDTRQGSCIDKTSTLHFRLFYFIDETVQK